MDRSTFSVIFCIKVRKKNADGLAPIYMRITVNKQKVELSIHNRIDPKDWDQKRQGSIGRTKGSEDINDYLQQCQSRVYLCKKKMEYEEVDISALSLKNRYLGFDRVRRSIVESFTAYNIQVKERVGVDITAATLQKYSVCLKHLQDFILFKYKRKDMLLKEVNHEFVRGFEHYLSTRAKQSHNTTVKTLRTFRTIVKEALNNDWMRKDPFAKIKLSIRSIQRDRLNDDELNVLATKKIQNPRLSTVRDIFLFSCYTGLAYSDVKALRWDHIEKKPGEKWRIVKLRKKTSASLRIPVLPQAKIIMKKYLDDPYCLANGLVFPVKSNQKMNEYLKEIAAICNIKKNLSTHIGRHTFATTVALANGLSLEVTQSILGHSSAAMTRIYAKMTDKRVDMEMDVLAEKLAESVDFSEN